MGSIPVRNTDVHLFATNLGDTKFQILLELGPIGTICLSLIVFQHLRVCVRACSAAKKRAIIKTIHLGTYSELIIVFIIARFYAAPVFI